MMSKTKIFIVKLHLIPFDVLVCLGSKREDIIKYLHRYRIRLTDREKESLIMRGNGMALMLEGNQSILWTKYYPKPGSGTLAHEIFHVVDYVTDRTGMRLVAGSEEIYAYMIQYLTNQIRIKM